MGVSIPLGRSFLNLDGFSGFSVRCFVAVAIGVSASKGGFPVISSEDGQHMYM